MTGFFIFIPGVPKKFTRLFENNKKIISLTTLVIPFLDYCYFNLNFGILQSKTCYKLRKLWLSELQICGKMKTRRMRFAVRITQFLKFTKSNLFTYLHV